MKRLRERIPREMFQAIFRPVVRELGTRTVVLRMNEAARTAIARQSKLDQVMPKLELLIYERQRPKADEELERLWSIYFEQRIEAYEERFEELSKKLNENLDQDKMPEDEHKRQAVAEAIDAIESLLAEADLSAEEIEATFRIKAFPEVLEFYLSRQGADRS